MNTNSIKHLMKAVMACCIASATITACGDNDDSKDMTQPTITGEGMAANPINCQVYHPGDVIPFRYLMTDDTELGNYNIEIHDNFDHHSHSTEADDHGEGSECEGHNHDSHEHEGPDDDHEGHTATWVFNQSFEIPAGQTRYEASTDIQIPQDVLPGDYHFIIRVTDKAGWQQIKAIAIIIED